MRGLIRGLPEVQSCLNGTLLPHGIVLPSLSKEESGRSSLEKLLSLPASGLTVFCLLASLIPSPVFVKLAMLNMRLRYLTAVHFRESFTTNPGFSMLGV